MTRDLRLRLCILNAEHCHNFLYFRGFLGDASAVMIGVCQILSFFLLFPTSGAFLSLSRSGKAFPPQSSIRTFSERRDKCFQREVVDKPTQLSATMEVWCDCRSSEKQLPDNASIDALLDTSDSNEMTSGKGIPLYTLKDGKDQSQDRIFLDGKLAGILVNITEEKGQQTALAAVGSVEWIVAYGEGDEQWRMIPAENLIGAATQTGTKICFVVERVQDVVGLSQALQVGVDALCVPSDASQDLWDAVIEAKDQRQEQAASNPQKPTMREGEAHDDILSGKCWRMEISGSGSSVVSDRVCIDFVQALEPTEGCWIGSSAKIMPLVLSEAAASSFVPSRPFRVNAGPVHSYVCLGDGVRTKYLCELQAGDEVLVYNAATGESRPVAVGRLKIEVRPCVLVGLHATVESSDEGRRVTSEGQVFLQQAETVRLGKEGGDFIRVTDLHVASSGDAEKHVPILLRVTTTGTHVGGRYEGKVTEM